MDYDLQILLYSRVCEVHLCAKTVSRPLKLARDVPFRPDVPSPLSTRNAMRQFLMCSSEHSERQIAARSPPQTSEDIEIGSWLGPPPSHFFRRCVEFLRLSGLGRPLTPLSPRQPPPEHLARVVVAGALRPRLTRCWCRGDSGLIFLDFQMDLSLLVMGGAARLGGWPNQRRPCQPYHPKVRIANPQISCGSGA